MVAHDSIGSKGAPSEGCISEVCASDAFERFSRNVLRGGGPHCGIRQCARTGLGGLNQFTKRFVGAGTVDGNDLGRLNQLSNGIEGLQAIVGQCGSELGVDGQAVGNDDQGVAIGGCFGNQSTGNDSATTWAVVYEHRLPPSLGQKLTDHSRHGVCRAACRERHHNAHWFGRVGCSLRCCKQTGQRQATRNECLDHNLVDKRFLHEKCS